MDERIEEELPKEFYNDEQLDEIVKVHRQAAIDEEDRKFKMMILSLVCDIRNSRGESEKLLEEIESLRSQLAAEEAWKAIAEASGRALQQAEKERNHIKAARQATFTRLLKVTEANTAMREDIWLLIDDYNSRINSADETTKEGKIRRGEYQSILDELIPILSRYHKEGDTL